MPVDLSKFEGMTPGPWACIIDNENECWKVVDTSPEGSQSHDNDYADEYIANVYDPENTLAIAAVPDLIAEVRELRAERDRLREVLGEVYVSVTAHDVLSLNVIADMTKEYASDT
jgi:hypothetical protein